MKSMLQFSVKNEIFNTKPTNTLCKIRDYNNIQCHESWKKLTPTRLSESADILSEYILQNQSKYVGRLAKAATLRNHLMQIFLAMNCSLTESFTNKA